MQEEKKGIKVPNNLIIENRTKASISGVIDVDSFDESTIIVNTDIGELSIKGIELNITKLSLETGEMFITGDIASASYSDSVKNEGGIISRLFK